MAIIDAQTGSVRALDPASSNGRQALGRERRGALGRMLVLTGAVSALLLALGALALAPAALILMQVTNTLLP